MHLKDLSLYIHIPYCEHKCIYCDFYSETDFSSSENFIKNLKTEIETYAENYSTDNSVKTIFFGGGTPSVLDPQIINDILLDIRQYYAVDENAEITMESNPGTLSEEKLNGYLDAGVNRLSVGVQSFFDDELKTLSRIHDSKTAIDTIERARKIGFKNINLDMIFGLPQQSFERWVKNLEIAVSLPIDHISSYSLIVEENTPLFKMVERGQVKILNDEMDSEFYLKTVEFYKNNGFEQYEVSNFAKEGFECKHNLAYWEYKNYLGFGPSAHSFYEGKRWYNVSNLKDYNNFITMSGDALSGTEMLDEDQKLFEYVMLGFRSRGVDTRKLVKLFGEDWLMENMDNFKLFEEKEFLSYKNGIISLTPLGYSMCDEILTKIL